MPGDRPLAYTAFLTMRSRRRGTSSSKRPYTPEDDPLASLSPPSDTHTELPCPHRRTPPFSHCHTHPYYYRRTNQEKHGSGGPIYFVLFFVWIGCLHIYRTSTPALFLVCAIVINKRRLTKNTSPIELLATPRPPLPRRQYH